MVSLCKRFKNDEIEGGKTETGQAPHSVKSVIPDMWDLPAFRKWYALKDDPIDTVI